MGRLSTALNLPKQIFLKDWGATEFPIDPNILLSFTFILEPTPLDGSIITYSSVYSPSYPAPQKIYFWGSYWELRDIGDNSAQWFNNSSSTILPLTGWEIDNAQGPAGTITPILTNTKNISINKQNLGGGKLNLFKSSIVLPPSLEITPLGVGYNVGSVNSTSSGMPQTISYFGNPLDQTGYISNSLTNTNHYWTFTIANGYKIYFALDSGGYSPSNIDSSIAIRSGSTWVESNILSQQNFGQNQQGQYILSSAQPYSAGTYSLRITNLTATTVSYRIRFIISPI
jgi:hypothetical protein